MNRTLIGLIQKTERGFERATFTDINGQECSLQQSSLAEYERPGVSAIWLGVGEHRMHLDVAQVADIVIHLQSWLEHGSFRGPVAAADASREGGQQK